MNDDPAGSDREVKRWSLPSWRRLTGFFLTVAQLERSYEAFKSENARLKARVSECERLLADHGGQLKLLAAFVQDALRTHVETTAERAALRALASSMGKRPLPSGETG